MDVIYFLITSTNLDFTAGPNNYLIIKTLKNSCSSRAKNKVCLMLYLEHLKAGVLVLYRYITNHTKTYWFKTTTIILLSRVISVGRVYGGEPAGWFWLRVSQVCSQMVTGATAAAVS